MDDERLLAAVAEGDQKALRELYERHAPWVAARLRRTLPPAAVEDAMQETFVAVWRGAKGHARRGEVGAWIWGIARRQAALWARRNGRPEPSLDEVGVAAPVSGEDPAAVAIRNADLTTAMAALGPNGEMEREVVRLVYVEDRPLAEVAGLLGIPQGTVKSRLHRARRLLRAALTGGT